MSDSSVVKLLKKLQEAVPHNKIVIYDFNVKHPLYFIEADGSVWKVDGSCDGCTQFCCDVYPPAYPEFDDGKGGCIKYKREMRDGVLVGRCIIQWNKPLGCAMYPFNNPQNLGPHRATWDEKNCQYKVRKIAE